MQGYEGFVLQQTRIREPVVYLHIEYIITINGRRQKIVYMTVGIVNWYEVTEERSIIRTVAFCEVTERYCPPVSFLRVLQLARGVCILVPRS